VFEDYCRPRVLTAEYAPGRSFEAMLETTTPEQRRRYGEILYRFVYGSLNRFRLFNADPHPGNYLFPDDGSVVFLDFGSVKVFRSKTRDDIQGQMGAVLANDPELLVKLMSQAGFIAPGQRVDAQQLLTWFRMFDEPIIEDREWTYTPEFAKAVIRSTTDPRGGYMELLRHLNLPPDYLTLNRIQWGVNSLLGRLGARANWYRILLEFWEDGPPATALGAEERPFIDASLFRA
jgi:hypothetical protein